MSETLTLNSGRDYKHVSKGNVPVFGTGGIISFINESLSEDKAVGIGRKGTIDVPQLLLPPFWTVDTLFYALPLEGVNIDFIYYLFHTIPWRRYNEASGVPSLSRRTINGIIKKIPQYDEQTKISRMLTRLDFIITKNQKKHKLLLDLKEHLLTFLFEETKSLKETTSVPLESFTSYQPSKHTLGQVSKDNSGGKYAVYGANQIINYVDYYDQNEPYISIVKDGAGVGRMEMREGFSSIIATMGYIIPENINIQYLYGLLSQIRFERYITGTTIPHIYYKDYKNELFNLPDLSIQELHGSLLFNVKKQLEKKKVKIQKLKELKSVYLKTLFI